MSEIVNSRMWKPAGSDNVLMNLFFMTKNPTSSQLLIRLILSKYSTCRKWLISSFDFQGNKSSEDAGTESFPENWVNFLLAYILLESCFWFIMDEVFTPFLIFLWSLVVFRCLGFALVIAQLFEKLKIWRAFSKHCCSVNSEPIVTFEAAFWPHLNGLSSFLIHFLLSLFVCEWRVDNWGPVLISKKVRIFYAHMSVCLEIL